MPTVFSVPLEFEVCILDDNYEICKTYPHKIRKIENYKIIKEHTSSNGYTACLLNRKLFYKHQIIAKQFIENPENYKCIDHINHCRNDNRIENLRWCSHRQNSNQRVDQTFVEKLPDDKKEIIFYNSWEFENLFFHDNNFYVFNGLNYVIKPKFVSGFGFEYVQLKDKFCKTRKIYMNRFRKENRL